MVVPCLLRRSLEILSYQHPSSIFDQQICACKYTGAQPQGQHVSCRELADPRSTAGLAAILAPNFDFAAGPGTIFVTAAQPCLGVKPDAGRAEKRAPGGAASLIIGEEFGQDVRPIRLQALPSVFAVSVENPIKWW